MPSGNVWEKSAAQIQAEEDRDLQEALEKIRELEEKEKLQKS